MSQESPSCLLETPLPAFLLAVQAAGGQAGAFLVVLMGSFLCRAAPHAQRG